MIAIHILGTPVGQWLSPGDIERIHRTMLSDTDYNLTELMNSVLPNSFQKELESINNMFPDVIISVSSNEDGAHLASYSGASGNLKLIPPVLPRIIADKWQINLILDASCHECSLDAQIVVPWSHSFLTGIRNDILLSVVEPISDAHTLRLEASIQAANDFEKKNRKPPISRKTELSKLEALALKHGKKLVDI